jgi:DNA-binding protein Fis
MFFLKDSSLNIHPSSPVPPLKVNVEIPRIVLQSVHKYLEDLQGTNTTELYYKHPN